MPIVDKLYQKSTGSDLFNLCEDAKEPLVEGLLYRNDYIMLVAQAKIGKTIFMQQLTACMTSGTPFLGVFDIPKPLNIWYFATEGRTNDLKERFIRIDKKNKIDTGRLSLFKSFFKFNSEQGIKCLKEIIKDNLGGNPDVIIIDALYRGFQGSLKDDEATNSFNGVMAELIEQLNCSIILVHHLKKPGKDEKGQEVRQGGQDSYGSTFFDANLDHKFHLDKWRDREFPGDRVLKCKLQRSGNIVDNIRIRLHAKDKLYFELVSLHAEGKNRVVKILHSRMEGYGIDDIVDKANLGRSTAYAVVKELCNDGTVDKTITNTRHVLYSLTGNS